MSYQTSGESARADRIIRDLERRLNILEQRRHVIPGFAPTPLAVLTGVIGSTGNQALVTGQTGIRKQTSAVSGISTAYDPSTSPTTTSDPGIGWADLRRNGASTGTKVLIVHDTNSPLQFDLLGGDIVVLAGPVTVTVTPSGSVSCYYAVWM